MWDSSNIAKGICFIKQIVYISAHDTTTNL